MNVLLYAFLKRHELCKPPPGASSQARPHPQPVFPCPGRGGGTGVPLSEREGASMGISSPGLVGAWETFVQMHGCRQLPVGCPRFSAARGGLWVS